MSSLSDANLQVKEDNSSAGLAIGAVLLLGLLAANAKSKDSSITPISVPVKVKSFRTICKDIDTIDKGELFLGLRHSMSMNSVHNLESLFSLSLYPLITSTVIRALNGIKDGNLPTMNDVRLYVYMNFYMKSRKDHSTNNPPIAGMLAYKANYFSSSNEPLSTNDLVYRTANLLAAITGVPTNDVTYLTRHVDRFFVHPSNPLSQVNPPEGFRIITSAFYPQFSDTWHTLWNSAFLTTLTPELVDSNGKELASNSIVTSWILNKIKTDASEYSSGFIKNMGEEQSWMDIDNFYQKMNRDPTLDENSAFFQVYEADNSILSKEQFLNKLANNEISLPHPASEFINLVQSFASMDPSSSNFMLMKSIEGDSFAHFADITFSGDGHHPDMITNTADIFNLGQTCFLLVDDIIIRALKTSKVLNDNFFPPSFLATEDLSSARNNEWAEPLLCAQERKYTYTYYDPFDPNNPPPIIPK